MGEDKNNKDTVVDFTAVKLQHMYDEYKRVGIDSVADDIMQVLVEYKLGNADVIWKDGLPFVRFKKKKDDDGSEEEP